MSLQFVVRNMSAVVRTRDWKERLISQPALMAEVGSVFIPFSAVVRTRD